MNAECCSGYFMSFNTVRCPGNFEAMEQTITLEQALHEMNTGKEFSLVAVTCDLDRKTGGERLRFERAVLSNPHGRNHYRQFNDARNIRMVGTSNIRKVRPYLMIKFNEKTITL